MIDSQLGGDSHRILSSKGADLAFTVVYDAVAWQSLIRVKGQVQLGRSIAKCAWRGVVCEHTRRSSHGDAVSSRGLMRGHCAAPMSSAAARIAQQRGLAYAADQVGLRCESAASAFRCHDVMERQQ